MMFPLHEEKKGAGFGALVLAAGDSLRMGQPKATLRVQGQPAWLRLARVSLGAGAAQVVVLTSADVHDLVSEQLPLGADTNRKMMPLAVPEKLRRRGPIGSVLHGMRSTRDSKGWLLWPVDHPFVDAETIGKLVGGDGRVRLPRYQERRGHPLFLDESCRDELLELIEKGKTLRDFVRANLADVEDIDVGDPAIHWNCDSPAAFRTWLSKFEELQDQAR